MPPQIATEGEKPTIVISHGAFHGPPHFQPLIESFRMLGFPVVCRRHPSNGDDTDFTENSLYDDARALRLEIERLVLQGKRVLVLAHSYGGMVMSEAVTAELGFDKIKGQRGGVLGLIYVCAFMVQIGESLAEPMAKQQADATESDHSTRRTVIDGSVIVDNGTEIFYHDIEDHARWQSLIRPMSVKALYGKLSRAAWNHFPSMYLYCTLDRAIHLHVQQRMVDEVKKADSGARVLKEVTMETGHSPFLKDPDTLARHVAGFAKQCDEGQGE